MKLFKLFFLFAFSIFYNNLGRSSAVVELKLRVHYELVNPSRKMRVVLLISYINDGIKLDNYFGNIKSDENFKLNLKRKADEDSKYDLFFNIYLNPIDNEFVPDQISDDDDDDDRAEIGGIWSMSRGIAVALFEPNFSNRYLINLGNLEPQGLWFNRKIFIDSEKDCGNYHAFVYATVYKHRRNGENLEEKLQFLQYAPLSKINNASNSQQKELSSEYRLSIPINLTRLFKHQILGFELRIYQYEESKYSADSLIVRAKSDGASADKTEQICSICLEPLIEGQIVIKLHGQNGDKFVHMFHKDCIKEWFDRRGHLRCPLCNVALNVEMGVEFSGKFENVADSFSNLYMNSVRQLFQIANGDDDDDDANADNFKRRQAEKTIKFVFSLLKKSENELKKALTEMEFQNIVVPPFLDAENNNFIEIRGEAFVKHPLLETIQKQLKSLVNNRQNSHQTIWKAENALRIVDDLSRAQQYAAYGLENMKNVSEKETKTKFETLISHLKKSKS